MFCHLFLNIFLGNRGFTHATRCAKTIDFACVLVYFSEFSKSRFREIQCFVAQFLDVFLDGENVSAPFC